MLVDLDYFFAQCEERRNPSIKDKPIVVCVYSGRTQDSGAVSTANYLARKYGVNSGMPIIVAKRKLKDLDAVFLPVDKKFYKQTCHRLGLLYLFLLRIIYLFSPVKVRPLRGPPFGRNLDRAE